MTKDAAGLAAQSLSNSTELARATLDNSNDLMKAASEISSRISFIGVQIEKAKADAEKITDLEVKAEVAKNLEVEQDLFNRASSRLEKLNALLQRLKKEGEMLEAELSKKPEGKNREEQAMSTMRLSLDLMKGIIACERDYLKASRELALVRFHVETLEDLIAGEITFKDARRALKSRSHRQ